MDAVKKYKVKFKSRSRRVTVLLGILMLSGAMFAQSGNQGEVLDTNNPDYTAPKNGLLKNWFIGVNGGGTFMLSSLHEKPYSWAAGAVLGKQLNRKVAIRADYLYGKMHAEGTLGGLTLANDVDFMDAALLFKMSLNDFVFTNTPKFLREFYVFGGGGVTLFNSKVVNTTTNTFVIGQGWDATGTVKTDKVMTPFVPLGAGLAFNISDRFYITTEFSYRYSQDNLMDGGISTKATNYTYTSLGFVYNIGKPSFTPQQITSDVIENKVKSSVSEEVKKEMTAKIESEMAPLKEEVQNQTKALNTNKEAVLALQEEIETRINALNESLKAGTVTTQMPDGTTQQTPVTQIAGGSVPTLTSIYFAFNSLYITAEMQREIAVIAKIMKKNRDLKCEITGNASNVGSPEYNMMLSQKRAEAVARLLVDEFGISENRLTIKSIGLTDPLAKNLQNINRRVDLQLFR
ncbi:MAG: OmpA family protein [Bacteroidales bacterium]|nr:OmpA family protein [Bacteroidales bacterium]